MSQKGPNHKEGDEIIQWPNDAPLEDLKDCYSAAGVIPFVCWGANANISLLLPHEWRDSASFASFRSQLHLLGGKKNDGETPAKTAAREASEELNYILEESFFERLLKNRKITSIFWLQFGKYVLFIVDVTEINSFHQRLPADHLGSLKKRSLKAEAEKIEWVPWTQLCSSEQNLRERKNLSDFLQKIVQNPLIQSFFNKTTSNVPFVAPKPNVSGVAILFVKHTTEGDLKLFIKETTNRDGMKEMNLVHFSLDRLQTKSLAPVCDPVQLTNEFASEVQIFDVVDDTWFKHQSLVLVSKSYFGVLRDIKSLEKSFKVPSITLGPGTIPSAALAAIIQNANVQQRLLGFLIKKQRVALESLGSLDDDQLATKKFGQAWRLALKSPNTLLSFSPIKTVKRDSNEHNHFLEDFPDKMKPLITNFREVNVVARKKEYDQAIRSLTGQKIKPIFHGTPERWRATAIAMHGFDLKIRLHGRALGDGVYTTRNPHVSENYVKANGSMLIMEGFQTKDQTTQDGTQFVFKNPHHVLPLRIADFGADEAECTKLRQEEKAKLEKENQELANLKASIAAKETEHLKATCKRWRKAKDFYLKQLETTKSLDWYWQETRQFNQNLPIYAYKSDILEKFKNNDVLIVMAETGSGKSTQIPQYLLHHYLTSTIDEPKKRCIAVLQPRRVNATTLAERVAFERDQNLGDEIGYRIGRGDSNTSANTRIEYMTHGLFVQLAAKDPKKLVENYCAVVLDEAHERSVEIDFSLGILSYVLNNRNQTDPSFKVIVASATISDMANLFEKFFLNKNRTLRVKKMSLDGSSFPVHIHYQSDFSPDPKEIGTGGRGTVMSTYALQVALKLLENCPKITPGSAQNILVFLPGEAHINRAIKDIRRVYGKPAQAFDDDSESDEEDLTDISMTVSVGGEKKNICVYPFHGKLTKQQQQLALNPRTDIDHMIVFTTNIAETGLTIPNVRYVIDTGLERQVTWNPTTRMQQMVTVPVTKSAMNQRAGRAGRVGSGICVRLFSPEFAETLEPNMKPEIETSSLSQSVLRLCSLKERGIDISLPGAIPEQQMKEAKSSLRLFSALDDKDTIAKEGNELLNLGMDLSLGRFLIACSKSQTTFAGAKVAALLLTNAYTKLLPKKDNSSHPSKDNGPRAKFNHSQGDLFTLLNIFEAWEAAKNKSSWCTYHRYDSMLFEEAEKAFNHIMVTLGKLGDRDTTDQRESKLLRAFVAGFFDYVAVLRRPDDVNEGFVWLAEVERSTNLTESIQQFSKKYGPAPAEVPNAQPSTAIPTPQGEVRLALTSSSSLWSAQPPEDCSLIVFYSVMVTDGNGDRQIPKVSVATYISPEDIADGAKEWCNAVSFDNLQKNFVRERKTIKIDQTTLDYIKSNHSEWLSKLRQKLPQISVKYNEKPPSLDISAPAGVIELIERKVNQAQAYSKPEKYSWTIPLNKVGGFIGKEGKNINALRQTLAKNINSAPHGIESTQLNIDENTGKITLSLSGDAKPWMTQLVKIVQDNIMKTCSPNPSNSDFSFEYPQKNERLTCLAIPTLNRPLKTRDDVMLFLAHTAIWTANCSVYGGFVRDWVIRAESANDIDVLVSDGNISNAESAIINTAKKCGVALVKPGHKKGAAWTLEFKLPVQCQGANVEVDLVDPTKVPFTSPGVDCDVGNMMVSKNGLELKVKNNPKLLHLETCVRHCQQKKFVFYYDPTDPVGKKRLEKYLSRGWTYLNTKAKYSQQFF